MTSESGERQRAVDIYRGFVMFLLLPDLYSGFSATEVAHRLPDSPVWAFLARVLYHAPWSGMTLWDFIMPSFVFLVGVAMSLSARARTGRGEPRTAQIAHVLIRSAAMLVLSLIFRFRLQSRLEEAWPLAFVLALGLPIPRWVGRSLGVSEERSLRGMGWIWDGAVIALSAVWVAYRFDEIRDLDLFGPILTQLALITPLAFLVVGRSRRTQVLAAGAILAMYWLAFALWPLPAPGFDQASVGVHPGDEVFQGFLAHWNKGTNFASAFDVWFLNLLPRSSPYVFNDHGLQTLNFVPTIASMIFGVIAGDLVLSGLPKPKVRNVLIGWGITGVVSGALAGFWICPIVKSIWTPSWTLFSGGLTVLTLGLLVHLSDVRRGRPWGHALGILGTNAILLYTLSNAYRWWPLVHLNALCGGCLRQAALGPFYESVIFLLILWVVAYVLYRRRIFIRF